MAGPEQATEICFLYIDHWLTRLTKSEWASWFQAIFSVVAILASAGAVYWQVTRQRREREQEAVQAKAQAIKDIAESLEHVDKWVGAANGLASETFEGGEVSRFLRF